MVPIGHSYVIIGALGEGGGGDGGGVDPNAPIALNSYFQSERDTAGGGSFVSRVTGDTNYRFIARADGMLRCGDGSAAQDVTLYRQAANTLATDDSRVVGGNRSVQGAISNFGIRDMAMPSRSATAVNVWSLWGETSFPNPGRAVTVTAHLTGRYRSNNSAIA